MKKWRGMFIRSTRLEKSEAIILDVTPTGEYSNAMTEARVLLQIMPGNGRNYVVESKEYLPLELLQTLSSGRKTTVYFDPAKPTKIHWIRIPPVSAISHDR